MSRPPRVGIISRRGAESAETGFEGKHPLPDCSIELIFPGVLSEVARRTSPRHSVVSARSYSWLRYTVTISIPLKS